MARYTKGGDVVRVPQINSELEQIETSIADLLSRKGDTPNEMLSTLDMNSNRITNLPTPVNASDAARFSDVVGGAFTVLTDEALVFDNVLEMTAADLVAGQYVRCKRYYSGGDLVEGLVYEVVASATVDNFIDHANVNGTFSVLIVKNVINSLQAGARPSISIDGNSTALQAMLNYSADNKVKCELAGSGLEYKIKKGLQTNSRHDGLHFDCGSNWLKAEDNASSVQCIRVGNGYFLSSAYEDAGDFPIADINIKFGTLNLCSSVAIEAKINEIMDAPTLLPENGGTPALHRSEYDEIAVWVNADITRNTSGLTIGLTASGGVSDYTIDLSTFELNVQIDNLNVKDFGSNGCIVYNKANVNIANVDAENIHFHPFGSTVFSEYATDTNAILNIDIDKIKAKNAGTCFDFSAQVKEEPTLHGNAYIGKAFGEWIRGRTKIHGGYDSFTLGDFYQSMRAGGRNDLGSWPMLTLLETKLHNIGNLISNTEQYVEADITGLYVDSVTGYGMTVNVDNIITDVTDGAELFLEGRDDNVLNIKNVIHKGSSARSCTCTGGEMNIGNYLIGKEEGSLLNVTDFGFITAPTSLNIDYLKIVNVVFSGASQPVIANNLSEKINLNHVELLLDATSTANQGVLIASTTDGADIAVGRISTNQSMRTLIRGTGTGTALVYFTVKDLNTQSFVLPVAESAAGSPILTYMTRLVTDSFGYVWWDGTDYRANESKPATLVDGTIVAYV